MSLVSISAFLLSIRRRRRRRDSVVGKKLAVLSRIVE